LAWQEFCIGPTHEYRINALQTTLVKSQVNIGRSYFYGNRKIQLNGYIYGDCCRKDITAAIFTARVAVKLCGLFVALTIRTMDHSYHSLVPGIMVCTPQGSAHQQRRQKLILHSQQHQDSSQTAQCVSRLLARHDADRPAVGAVSMKAMVPLSGRNTRLAS